MSVKRLRSGKWLVDLRLGLPEQRRFKRRYPTRKAAAAVEALLQGAVALGQAKTHEVLQDLTWNRSTPQRDGQPATWTEVSKAYYRHHCEPRNRDLANKRSRLGRFDRYFANRLAADITPLDFDEYAAIRRTEGVTNATINRDLAVARHVFNWARGKRLIRENPLDAYQLFEEERAVRHVDEDEIHRVMQSLPPVQRDGIFRFIYETGCRKSEATGLLWEDVNPELRIARARRTKSGKDRYLPLTTGALEAMTVQPRICPWVFYSERTQQPYQDIRKPWETARRKAECPHLLIKDLRTAFANRLEADYGVAADDIALLMGHFDKSTTQKHYLEDRTAEKISGLLRTFENKKG